MGKTGAEGFQNTQGGRNDDEVTLGNKIPDNDSVISHIFRSKTGHLKDTPENRNLLETVANTAKNFLGKDKYGNEWYAKIQSDGSQVWVQVKNGRIFEGGINSPARSWNPETGLKMSARPW